MTRSLTVLVLGLLMVSASAVGGEPEQDPFDKAYELYCQGRYREAEAQYRKALSQNPDSIGANLELGRLLRETGRSSEAIPFLVRALKLSPKLAAAAAELGTAQLALKDWENAERNLRIAVKLDARDADSWWRLGYVYTQLGKFPESEKALKKAVGIDPDLSEAWLDLGLLQRITGKTKEAIASLRTAMETDPSSAVAFNQYAEIVDKHGDERQRTFVAGMRAHNEGDFKAAEECINKRLADDPEDGRCLILMGHIHLHQNPPKSKEAIEFYDKGLANLAKAPRAERLPYRSRSYAVEGLGIAYLMTDDLKNAKSTFKLGTKLDKGYAGHFYYLAVVAAREGKTAEVYKKLADVRMRDYDGSWVRRAKADSEFKSFKRRKEFLEALQGKG
ncbi:MAG: tetratricopeptide repeat protein [Planctomycetota bacterium]|jgi:tetratricopeptide (TPR) repeat protein